jgi:group I intron endonuclease
MNVIVEMILIKLVSDNSIQMGDSVESIPENMGCIYLITNTSNNKQYVGQSKFPTPDRRYKSHWWASLKPSGLPKRDNTPLHRAMRKYGPDCFKVESLCVAPHKQLNKLEAHYAEKLQTYTWDKPDTHPPGYNATWCGRPTWIGMKHSDESKANMSAMRKGVPLSGKWRENVIAAAKRRIGEKKSAEYCRKLSERMKGRKVSDRTKGLLSLARKGKKLSAAHKAKLRVNHSLFWKGHKHSLASRNKMRQAQLGKKRTAESVEKGAAKLRGRKQHETQIENARMGRIANLIEHGAKNVKLNKDSVLEIIRRQKEGETQTDLAKEFEVADSVITRILTGERWGHVTGIKPVEKTGAKRVKLGEEKAKQIRELYAIGDTSYDKLAEKFGVNKTTIAKIVKGVFYPDTA